MLKENPTASDVRAYYAACKRKTERKAKKSEKAKQVLVEEKHIGSWWLVRTMTGIVPFNMHGKTTYLVGSGITCIAEKTKSGFRIYLTGGRPITTKKQLQELIDRKVIKQPVIARRSELSVIKPIKDLI